MNDLTIVAAILWAGRAACGGVAPADLASTVEDARKLLALTGGQASPPHANTLSGASPPVDALEGTYADLTKDGHGWGIRVFGTNIAVGQRVRVTTKKGEIRYERVAEVLRTEFDRHTGQDVTLCVHEQKERDQ